MVTAVHGDLITKFVYDCVAASYIPPHLRGKPGGVPFQGPPSGPADTSAGPSGYYDGPPSNRGQYGKG